MFYGFGASPMLADGTLRADRRSGHGRLSARRSTRRPASERWQRRGPTSSPAIRRRRSIVRRPVARSSPDPRVVPAHRLRPGGRQDAVVGARARLRDEIGGERRRRHALHQRLGLPAEPAGTPGADRAIRRGAEALRQERRRPGRQDGSHRRHEPMDRMLGPDAASLRSTAIATASSTPATGTFSAPCSPPRTGCSPSSWAARAT